VKRGLLALGIMAILAMALAVPALADNENEEEITCTVTPGPVVSVTVFPTSVDYGIVDLGSSATSVEITATNNGSDTENFQIKGADATGGVGDTAWTLSDAVSENQYMHEFAKPTYPAEGSHAGWTALTTTYQELATGIPAGGTQRFKLQIWLPTSTTGYSERSTTVIILAVAE
jgi:hypothetical protein